MQFFDTLKVDDATVRTTRDGYLVASALTARTGVQTYTAKELGLTDRDPGAAVRVYRPPEAVFADKALASMAYRPITKDGHPRENVTSKNWRDLAGGNTGGDILRDGDYVRIPLVLMDEAAIQKWKDGRRELSWGYSADVVLQDGVVPEGELDGGQRYDAVQAEISCNHLAMCDAARGGDKLRIGDDNPKPGAAKMKTILVDGIPIAEVSDAAEAVILKLQKQLADETGAKAALEKTVADHLATISTKDGELAVAKKALDDAALTPAKLDDAVAARALVIDAAKRILGDDFDAKGLTDAAIRKAAVEKHLGDAAKALDDAGITGAFAALQVRAGDGEDTIRNVVKDGLGGASVSDAAVKARAAMIDSLNPKAATAQ